MIWLAGMLFILGGSTFSYNVFFDPQDMWVGLGWGFMASGWMAYFGSFIKRNPECRNCGVIYRG